MILYLGEGGNLCDEISPSWPLPRADRNFLFKPAEELGFASPGLILVGKGTKEQEGRSCFFPEPRCLGVPVLLHWQLGEGSSVASQLQPLGLAPGL